MYLCIENSGEVDIRSLCIMGVSIKEKENDKAIGKRQNKHRLP